MNRLAFTGEFWGLNPPAVRAKRVFPHCGATDRRLLRAVRGIECRESMILNHALLRQGAHYAAPSALHLVAACDPGLRPGSSVPAPLGLQRPRSAFDLGLCVGRPFGPPSATPRVAGTTTRATLVAARPTTNNHAGRRPCNFPYQRLQATPRRVRRHLVARPSRRFIAVASSLSSEFRIGDLRRRDRPYSRFRAS